MAPSAIESPFAADGIDELLVVFGSRWSPLKQSSQASTIIDLRCTDDDAA
jgi:hypothetical protein